MLPKIFHSLACVVFIPYYSKQGRQVSDLKCQDHLLHLKLPHQSEVLVDIPFNSLVCYYECKSSGPHNYHFPIGNNGAKWRHSYLSHKHEIPIMSVILKKAFDRVPIDVVGRECERSRSGLNCRSMLLSFSLLPINAPFPFTGNPLRAPLQLLRFPREPLTAQFPLTRFSARFVLFFAPLTCPSGLVRTTEDMRRDVLMAL